MPIDTPYNREIARQYNASNRKRANYMQVHMSPMRGSELILPPHSNPVHGNGYNMRMIGSGVGVYKKEPCCSDCADDKGCSGGNNPGLEPKARMDMNLGAGKKRELKRNANAGLYAYGMSGGAAGGMLGLNDLYNKGKEYYETGKKVVHKAKKVFNKGKEGYEHLKRAYDSGKEAYSELRAKGGSRTAIVRDVMAKQGLGMIEASKYVKQHNLY